MPGSKKKMKAQAKNEKKAGAQAKTRAEKEAACVGIPAAKSRAKGKAKAGCKTLAELKAISKNRAVAELKEGALSEPKAAAKAVVDCPTKGGASGSGKGGANGPGKGGASGRGKAGSSGPGKAGSSGPGKGGSSGPAKGGASGPTKGGASGPGKAGASGSAKGGASGPAKGGANYSPKAKYDNIRSTDKNETGTDTWLWAGEEDGISTLFWNGEEAGNRSKAKSEKKANIGSRVKESESMPGPSCKLGSRTEDDEEETVIGNWFWEGDDNSFDLDPKPVCRIIKPQPVDEINEKNRPKDWSEVTIWPKAPAVTPAVLGFRSKAPSETKGSSYVVLASAEENTHSLPAATPSSSRSARFNSQSVPEYPFGSEPCIQTIDEIRRQIKIREVNGIKPFACHCKMECYMNSEEFEKLVSILKSTTDPLIHKIAQIAMGIHKVHPFAQEFINEVGVVTLIESLLSFPSPDMRTNTVITLNPPSGDERQHKVEVHVKHMCKETVAFPLNSPGQQSGLKILGQLTTEPVHHYIVANYFSELFNLLSQGNRKTRNLVLKLLLNMSENPSAARDMINVQALTALKLIFNQNEAKANLVTAVAIFINIKEHIRKGSIVVVDHLSYNTLTDIFREVKGIIEAM
ncbi:G protein-coupled receptor associated sorting protein 3 isoform X2 [Ochotona princeps]|uniref:G protein-coupled receptor associated sorting protein 3 isoform X2 n=1 Tax=Ochotona princeps TaxID=9978 RepID=UPI0027147FAB|nr:G protein-coupled receptor associated sorting protein 3 isoform X2 [Ochotona princeps]